tara:strand:- start:245 stop:496 length:252 start_codon:yes stop_codon:yes gene_type:complete
VAEIVYAVETHHNIVHFNSDSSALTMLAKLTLKELVEASRSAWQVLALQVIGYADTSVNADYNMASSEQQVAIVASYMAARGL